MTSTSITEQAAEAATKSEPGQDLNAELTSKDAKQPGTGRRTTNASERKLTRKGRAQRDRITRIAAELIYQHGVQGTNQTMVREAAGISGSQLTNYFADKESLVRAVIAWQADTMIGLHRDPPLTRIESLPEMREWALSYTNRPDVCRGGCSFGSLSSEIMKSDLKVHDEIAAGFDRWKALFLDGLEAMRTRGDLREDADPEQLAIGLMAAFQGGMLLSQAADSVAPLKAALDSALDHIEYYTVAPVSPTHDD
jgi:TetR/AcrR family transcriptional regulator, transcriptional repressor for nem operon